MARKKDNKLQKIMDYIYSVVLDKGQYSVSKKELIKLFEVTPEEVQTAISSLASPFIHINDVNGNFIKLISPAMNPRVVELLMKDILDVSMKFDLDIDISIDRELGPGLAINDKLITIVPVWLQEAANQFTTAWKLAVLPINELEYRVITIEKDPIKLVILTLEEIFNYYLVSILPTLKTKWIARLK